MAHAPYTRPMSDWLAYKGKEYQLQGWYGDGIVWTDPARGIVVRRDGVVVAVSGIGFSPDYSCVALEDCMVYLDGAAEGESGAWRLEPEKMDQVKGLSLGEAPNHWHGKPSAFAAADYPFLLKHQILATLAFFAAAIYGVVHLINRYLKRQKVI